MATLMSIENNGTATFVRLVSPEHETMAIAKVLGDILDEVWVAPQYRGSGLGRTFTQAVLQVTSVHHAVAVNPVMAHILETDGWTSDDGCHYVQ